MSKVEWCPELVEGRFMNWHIYILQCSDGSYYVGSTTDLDDRVRAHNLGRGAKFTYLRRPVHLIYSEPCENEESSVQRERQIKKWSRAKKEALVAGDEVCLRKLSKSRD